MRGSRIARIRRALKVTQTQLAQLMGVHSLTVSKWEREKLKPSAYQAALLAAFDTASFRDVDAGRRAVYVMATGGVAAGLHVILREAYGMPGDLLVRARRRR